MATISRYLRSISFDSRSGAPPGRRLLALTLAVVLVLASTFPGFALAGEADSEGEGMAPPVELPVAPDFDPGGEEEGLEETPASGGEEEGAVEAEAEVNLEAPPVDEVTGAPTEAPVEVAPPPIASPEPAATPQPEPVPQEASQPPEPVANQSIVAPRQSVEPDTASASAASGEAPLPVEPTEDEAPPPPSQTVAATPAEPGRNLAGKDTYVVRSGDCLWHIAEGLLSPDAGTPAIAAEVERLWRLNEERIGTGDPSLIYAGTTLRLR